jgi:hypothetical protein
MISTILEVTTLKLAKVKKILLFQLETWWSVGCLCCGSAYETVFRPTSVEAQYMENPLFENYFVHHHSKWVVSTQLQYCIPSSFWPYMSMWLVALWPIFPMFQMEWTIQNCIMFFWITSVLLVCIVCLWDHLNQVKFSSFQSSSSYAFKGNVHDSVTLYLVWVPVIASSSIHA